MCSYDGTLLMPERLAESAVMSCTRDQRHCRCIYTSHWTPTCSAHSWPIRHTKLLQNYLHVNLVHTRAHAPNRSIAATAWRKQVQPLLDRQRLIAHRALQGFQ